MNDKLQTPFEKGNGNQTASYQETIAYYQLLSEELEEVKLYALDKTDVGKPLPLVVVDKSKHFDADKTKKEGKLVLLINNAIHPGEPEGVDASMMLARDLINHPKKSKLLDHVVLLIVPMYNLGGALNSGCCSRANQNGPERYGFRGNARNLDLNRDFIKCDSKNAVIFNDLFTTWQPDVFIDNHTSNGADYQYVMTYIATQADKLQPDLAAYMQQNLLPKLEEGMHQKKFEMCPYVYSIEDVPDKGIMGFLETPRYSTGYTALHNCIGFVPETHMLKKFSDRVAATYAFSLSVLQIMDKDYKKIQIARQKANSSVAAQQMFPVAWQLDKTEHSLIDFKGYEAGYKPSVVTGNTRLFYDQSKPFTKKIKYFNRYKTTVVIEKPLAYIVPQAWTAVIERLKMNKVTMTRLTTDKKVAVEVYYIEKYTTKKNAYEGHYLHSDTQIRTEEQTLQFYAGDYLIVPNQIGNRYIVETLEPQATDSFFNWNFFDSILQQKEYFSPYVFEEIAADMLAKDKKLAEKLAEKQKDTTFAQNSWAVLSYLYEQSDFYENTHNRYPIARVIHQESLQKCMD